MSDQTMAMIHDALAAQGERSYEQAWSMPGAFYCDPRVLSIGLAHGVGEREEDLVVGALDIVQEVRVTQPAVTIILPPHSCGLCPGIIIIQVSGV